MSLIGWLHGKIIFSRRIQRLAELLSDAIPQNASVLDIGAGDGTLAKNILARRPDITISGLDVLIRPRTAIPVTKFDGLTIPFGDKSFDVAMFVDVIHHASDPHRVLAEAARVAKYVIIKDHLNEGILADPTLRFMDYVGNARHGVALPYEFWSRKQWNEVFGEIGVEPASWTEDLSLYKFPFSVWFDRDLHFLARLAPAAHPAEVEVLRERIQMEGRN